MSREQREISTGSARREGPHRVIIVGVGSIGERHLRCFLATGRARVCFVEPRRDLAEQIQQRYPLAEWRTSLDEALTSGATAAVIATPAPLHIPLAQKCLTADLDVLIEKPLSVSLEGIDALRAAAQRSVRTAAVAYVYRAHPSLAEMREVLLSGKLGRPLQLVATCGQNFPTYRPAYAHTYYADRRAGGGAVQDALTHVLNAGEWLVGPIERVVADVEHLQLPDVMVEDTAHVLTRQGDVMGSYSLNQHQAPNELTITIACENGTLRFENHLCRWRMMERPETPWIDSPPHQLERDTLFTRQADAFLDAIEDAAPPLCSLEEGLSTLRANLAILNSCETSRWVVTQTLDLQEADAHA